MQLHHKWCVHSVLPVATRVKQPTHVNTQNINCNSEEGVFCALIWTQTHIPIHTQYTGLWNSPGFNWQPEVMSGVDRTCRCGFCYVHVRLVGGGNIASCERVRNCSHVTDRYVSQQCQLRIGRCVRPSSVNSLRRYQISCRMDVNKRTKIFTKLSAEVFCLTSWSLFNHVLLFMNFN